MIGEPVSLNKLCSNLLCHMQLSMCYTLLSIILILVLILGVAVSDCQVRVPHSPSERKIQLLKICTGTHVLVPRPRKNCAVHEFTVGHLLLILVMQFQQFFRICISVDLVLGFFLQ